MLAGLETIVEKEISFVGQLLGFCETSFLKIWHFLYCCQHFTETLVKEDILKFLKMVGLEVGNV
jgi:hypothetical protein